MGKRTTKKNILYLFRLVMQEIVPRVLIDQRLNLYLLDKKFNFLIVHGYDDMPLNIILDSFRFIWSKLYSAKCHKKNKELKLSFD